MQSPTPTQEPQYFDPAGTPPSARPFFRTWKGAALIAAGVFVVVLVVVFVINTLSFGSVTDGDTELTDAIANCASSENPEDCEADARTDAARSSANTAACKGLEGAELTNCVELAAFASLKEKDCGELTDGDAKASCADQVRLRVAIAADDYSACAAVDAADVRDACQTRLLPSVIASGDCAAQGVDATVCDGATRMAAVVDGGDYAACNNLPSPYNTDCQDAFSSTDRDGDGLTRKRESQLGTSDDAADTDGDGYTDREELDSGYDPLH